jgi:hypothetical protein
MSFKKFREKINKIEAFEWDGGANPIELAAEIAAGYVRYSEIDGPMILFASPIGPLLARPGDWIVRWPSGDLLPYQPKDFKNLYESESEDEICNA